MRKNSIFLIVPFLISLLAVAGCSRRPLDIPDPAIPEDDPVEETIPGAPQAEHACRVTIVTENTVYSYFSLTEGGLYLIAFKDGSVSSGKYGYEDGVYLLDGFGTMRFVGTKADSDLELPDKVVITDEDGNESVFDCTIYKNTDKNMLFRSWKLDKTFLSFGDDANINFNGLDFDKLGLRMMMLGLPVTDLPSGVELRRIDISGTGEFTATFKFMNVVDLKEAFFGEWSELGDDSFLLDWDESFLKFMDRGEDPKPFKLSFGIDGPSSTLGLGFTLNMKNNNGDDIEASCMLLFVPNEDDKDEKK